MPPQGETDTYVCFGVLISGLYENPCQTPNVCFHEPYEDRTHFCVVWPDFQETPDKVTLKWKTSKNVVYKANP
jgi:hypothetical protein